MEWNGIGRNRTESDGIGITPQHYAREDINSKNNLKRLYS